jgi:uncharacterized RDD family membrane protein YckC
VQEIVTGEAVVLDLPCARFPTRMLARLIDLSVQVPALFVILVFTGVGVGSHVLDTASAAAVGLTGTVLVLVGYPVIFETLSRGRTLGKLALGLRVVADDGGPERFRQALVRGLAGAVECWLLLGVPALITSLFSARAKRLGDIFAGTFVLRERAPRPGPAPLPPPYPAAVRYPGGVSAPGGVPAPGVVSASAGAAGPGASTPPPQAPLAAWSASLDLSGLPEALAASAASYLSRYWELDASARDRLALRLAGDVVACVSPPPPLGMPPVPYLMAVLTERRNRELARFMTPSLTTPGTMTPSGPMTPPAPMTAGPAMPPAPATTAAQAATESLLPAGGTAAATDLPGISRPVAEPPSSWRQGPGGGFTPPD